MRSRTSNRLLSAMFVAAFAWSPATVHAATIFFDDFEDGDHLDGSPVSWDLAGPDPDDEEMVVDGSLVITSGGINRGLNWAGVDIDLPNVSIRSQGRVGHPDDVFSVGARGNVATQGNYYARVGRWVGWPTGAVGLGGLDVPEIVIPTDLQPYEEDVVLQLDVFGNQLSVWAWRPGEDMPDAPLITAIDNRRSSGIASVAVWNNPWIEEPVEGIYRYVHVADVHIHPGDFNNDGDVDGDDFLTWQQGYGMQSGAAPANGDADYDGDVDGDDFLIWQSEFSSGSGLASAVPEPALIALSLIVVAVGAFCQRGAIGQLLQSPQNRP